MKLLTPQNSLFLVLTAYILFTCQTTFGMSCDPIFLSDLVQPVVSNTSQTQTFEAKFLRFFTETKSFANLIEKNNSFQVDRDSSLYRETISSLFTKIQERKGLIEKNINKEEIITFSTTAEPHSLIIKFHHARSFIRLRLKRQINIESYDYDRDVRIVNVDYQEYENPQSFWSYFTETIDKDDPTNDDGLICRSGWCPFFYNKDRRRQAPGPNLYLSFSPSEQQLIQQIFKSEIARKGETAKWSKVSDSKGAPLLASSYAKGLETYLKLRKIPQNRWQNYRVSRNEIEVNLSDEEFDAIPWGTKKKTFVQDLSEKFLFAKKIDPNLSSQEILTSYFNHGLHRPSVSTEQLHMVEDGLLQKMALELGEFRPSLSDKINDGLAELRADFKEQFVERSQNLVASYNYENLEENYFLIDSKKIPIVTFSELPPKVQEFVEIHIAKQTINSLPPNTKYINRENEFHSIFRAPFSDEAEDIRIHNYYQIATFTNFEPFQGSQTAHFRGRPGYSGDLLELIFPTYLLVDSPASETGHPEVHLRFPVRTDNFTFID